MISNFSATATETSGELLERVNFYRLDAYRQLTDQHRTELSQFLTSSSTAQLMASMFDARRSTIHLLDAGAGVGTLTAAFIAELCHRQKRPQEISVTAYEIDAVMIGYLKDTLAECKTMCARAQIKFTSEILDGDFIEAAVSTMQGGLMRAFHRTFNCAILNPPYRKINSDSKARLLLRSIGIETSNLYTAFLALAVRLLELKGEVVAITPRSFANGPYFKPFRKLFLEEMTARRIHIFDSRAQAFADDRVLQENVIIHAIKHTEKTAQVTISSSVGPDDENITIRTIDHDQLVRPDDPDLFFHIVPDDLGRQIAERMSHFNTPLADLQLKVSTGRVVDFRAKEFLRTDPADDTAPLIYPKHFQNGFVRWPQPNGNKPQALIITRQTHSLFVPAGIYVLVKRFSAKEEKRRITAAIYDPARVAGAQVGFENHLNYYHANGNGLSETLAKGLAVFLNSTLVESYFRHFSGHTQVNATDLKSLRYPTRAQLEVLGAKISDVLPGQDQIDYFIEEELFDMVDQASDPIHAKKRSEEALAILKAVGLPRQQQNERSALTLLALLDLEPNTHWSKASNPLRGITQMMSFFSNTYGKTYAPNTRETVRRQTVHQFVEAGLAIPNPDQPERPTNSPKAVYQIEANALKLIRSFGTAAWEQNLKAYLKTIETLKKRYAQEREMKRIPLALPSGQGIKLSPGGQNPLIERILKEFCELYTPGGKPLYVGDTAQKWAYFDEQALEALGVTIEAHGKMPDVVVHYTGLENNKNWLVLIEAVTSHGPVNPKRRDELKKLFKGSQAGLVFVTAFLDRKTMVKHLNDISWETEVWIAEYPTHLIHFNGERFLGPYESVA
ncbi:BsuBI/PstI family type II restriction endonuclease [soil metagenome]